MAKAIPAAATAVAAMGVIERRAAAGTSGIRIVRIDTQVKHPEWSLVSARRIESSGFYSRNDLIGTGHELSAATRRPEWSLVSARRIESCKKDTADQSIMKTVDRAATAIDLFHPLIGKRDS